MHQKSARFTNTTELTEQITNPSPSHDNCRGFFFALTPACYNILMTKSKLKLALIINLFIIIAELYSHISIFTPSIYIMYTMLSNALLGIVAVIDSIYIIRELRGKKNTNPLWLQRLRFTAALSVLVTFIVTLTILTWSTGLGFNYLMFGSVHLFVHTLCPIVAVLYFITLRKYEKTTKLESLFGMSFTLLYAAVTLPLNIFKILEGPYPFLMVYKQPVWATLLWILIILGGCYGLSRALIKLNHKFTK